MDYELWILSLSFKIHNLPAGRFNIQNLYKRLILLGPTASGKSDVALEVAEALGTSIISADSRQCYRYLDIGTATPSPEELQRVTHYNISNLDPYEEDTAVKFLDRANSWEQQILQESDHVLYVGGSTLHLTGLIRPFHDAPDANEENICQLNERIEKEGIESLYELLKQVDPEYIPRMDGMNRQRIIRALDVWMQTGKPFSSFHSDDPIEPDEQTIVFGIRRDRQKLYDRINQRVDLMIKSGLIEETRAVLEKGYSPELQSLQTVGYREVIAYLNGDMSRETMIETIKTQTRRYAKRQLTWFRRWDFVHWLDGDGCSTGELVEEIEKYIKQSDPI